MQLRHLHRAPYARQIAAYVLVAVAAMFFPLTADLHYEFSALVALAASLIAGLGVAVQRDDFRLPPTTSTDDFPASLRRISLGSLTTSLSPLVIALVGSMFGHSCGLWEGTLWYLLLVPPSAWIGALLGLLAAMMTGRRWIRICLVLLFWSLSLIRGAYEGYSGPHIFMYAWQVGYFPGGSWDAELPISSTLLLYRFAHLVVAGGLAIVMIELQRARATGIRSGGATPGVAERPRRGRLAAAGLCALITVACIPFRSELGLTRTHAWLRAQLGDSLRTSHAIIYYDRTDADSVGLWTAANLTDFHVDDQARMLGIAESDIKPVTLYLFGSPEQQQRYVGAASASFTKPWARMLCQTFDRIDGTLRHELAHVMLAPYGAILGVPVSQGLLEGSAMAMENNYGRRTLHEYARDMYRLKLAPPVEKIMGFSGFSSHRSSVSYVLAGSFSKWLIDTYGMPRYLQALPWGDFEGAYGEGLESLGNHYRSFLESLVSTDFDSTATMRYLFGGGSFFFQKCLRRIGTLNAAGYQALARERPDEALTHFRSSLDEGVSYGARAGILRALLSAGRYREMLDSCNEYARDTAGYPLLPFLVEQGDACWALEDTASAGRLYDSAVALRISSSVILRASLRRRFMRKGGALAGIMRSYFTRPMETTQRLMTLDYVTRAATDPTDELILALMRGALTGSRYPATTLSWLQSMNYGTSIALMMRSPFSEDTTRFQPSDVVLISTLSGTLTDARDYVFKLSHADSSLSDGAADFELVFDGSVDYQIERRIERERYIEYRRRRSILP